MRKKWLLCALLAGCSSSAPALAPVPHTAPIHSQDAGTGQGNAALRVMTYNLNEGSDFLEIVAAKTTPQFLVAVGQTITQVRATRPDERMQFVAAQIVAAHPALVSLQEVDKWFSGPFDPVHQTCGATSMEFDMLPELLAALAAQGAHYQVAVQAHQYVFPPTPGLIPPSTFLCVQVTDDNVILARTDLQPQKLQLSNAQSGRFSDILSVTTPVGAIPLPRVWESVDVTTDQKQFRFINTHLESMDESVLLSQGAELRAVPGGTSLPVVIAMDSNAQAAPAPAEPAYTAFLTAGYQDAWTQVHPTDPGFTGIQAQLDNNMTSQLYQRIDLVLTLGPFKAKDAELFGADPASKTPDGLWPSDHAGVMAQLHLSGDDE